MFEFFMAMKPPTVTHQEKQVNWTSRTFYEPVELKQARAKLMAHLAKYAPALPVTSAIRLSVKWCFEIQGNHKDGDYRTSKPDTDNLQKLLKDCMTATNYWMDDAQVAEEFIGKYWAETPGIYIRVEQISGGDAR